jgi:hypothetical protein
MTLEKSLDGKKVTLNNKITVLGFGGSSILKIEVTFNLIKKFTNGIILSKTFSLMICPVGTESDINSIFDALEEFTDLAQWHFLPRRKRLILLCPIETSWKIR